MAEKKHLFGTSEKSDFILNMTEQGTKKLCGLYCIIAMLIITAAAIPYYFTKNVVDYVDNVNGMDSVHYVSEKAIYWMSTLMIGMGIIGFCIFLIGRMKTQVSLKDNKALLWAAAVLVMSTISALCADSLEYSFTGYFDRSEGLLSILGYMGFFAAAVTVTGESWRRNICDVLVGIGSFEAVVGILQSIPAVGEKIPNWFAYLFSRFGTDAGSGEIAINQVVYTKDYTASGFACTPFALAAILTVCFAAAVSGFIYDSSRIRKVLYALGGAVMTVCAVLTDVAPAIIGVGSAAVISLVLAIAYKIKNSDGKAQLVKAVSAFAAVGIIIGAMAAAGLFGLKDEQVIFTDTYDRISISAGQRSDTSSWIYPYLWDDGMYIVQNHPLLGTGPDNWQTMYKLGAVVDRSYNEYIDIAMQRGIITLVLYVVFLALTLKKAFSAAGRFFKGKNGWTACAVSCAVCAYLIQAFFNISSISSSPFFWLTVGLVWSFEAKGKAKE